PRQAAVAASGRPCHSSAPARRGSAPAGSKRNHRADAFAARPPVEVLGCREVLDGEAERDEHRQLLVGIAPRIRANEHLAELGPDVIGADSLLLDGTAVLAGLVPRRLPTIDKERSRGRRRRATLRP